MSWKYLYYREPSTDLMQFSSESWGSSFEKQQWKKNQCIRKHKRPQVVETACNRKGNPGNTAKPNHRARLTRTACFWQRDRHGDQWNMKEKLEANHTATLPSFWQTALKHIPGKGKQPFQKTMLSKLDFKTKLSPHLNYPAQKSTQSPSS